MADHAKFLATAVRLINKHGRQVTIKRMEGSDVADKPWRGNSDGSEVVLGTPLAAFVPASGSDFGSEFVSEELLARVSEIALVAGSTDYDAAQIINDGKDYRIEWVQRLKPADLTILYAFGISR